VVVDEFEPFCLLDGLVHGLDLFVLNFGSLEHLLAAMLDLQLEVPQPLALLLFDAAARRVVVGVVVGVDPFH